MLSKAQTIQEHFNGNQVPSHFYAFMQYENAILDVISAFGLTETLATFIMKEMERYIYGLKNVNMYFLSKPIFSIF